LISKVILSKDNIIEVNTILRNVPSQDVKNKILAEINLSSLVTIENTTTDKEELEKIVLIKVPTEIYPTLYETFIFLFKQAGIKNIQIDKEVNFEKMYNEKKNN
jgi:Preprotein translocase subunit SecB.